MSNVSTGSRQKKWRFVSANTFSGSGFGAVRLALLLGLLASSAEAQGRLEWDQPAGHRSDALIRYLYEASYAGGPFEQVQGVECSEVGVTSPFSCSGILTSELRPVRVRAVDIIDTVRYESAATAEGQGQPLEPPITGVLMTIYRQGQTSPAVAPQVVPLSAFTCDLQTMPMPTSINPGGIAFADPNRPGRFCSWQSPPNGVFSLIGYDRAQVYEFAASYVSDAGTGPQEARETFSKPGVPPSVAPAQLRLIAGQ